MSLPSTHVMNSTRHTSRTTGPYSSNPEQRPTTNRRQSTHVRRTMGVFVQVIGADRCAGRSPPCPRAAPPQAPPLTWPGRMANARPRVGGGHETKTEKYTHKTVSSRTTARVEIMNVAGVVDAVVRGGEQVGIRVHHLSIACTEGATLGRGYVRPRRLR